MKGLTTRGLSQRGARWKCKWGWRCLLPAARRKDPGSFTVSRHWILVLDA